jgi:hypothetical protein
MSIFDKDKRFSAYVVGLLELSWFINSDGARAYGFGSLFAVGGWLLCALAARNYARAASANPPEYAKLKEIYELGSETTPG